MNQNKKKRSGLISYILLLTVSMIWGFAFVAQRLGAEHVGAFVFNGVRFALGAVSLVPVVLIFEREKTDKNKNKNTIKYGIMVGTVLFLASSLQQYGIEITQSAGKSGFITALYTVFVPIASCVIYKQKKSIFVWLGATISLAGLFLLSVGEGFSVGSGDIMLLLCAFGWTAQIMMIDAFVGKVSPLKFSMVQFATCAILSLVGGLIFEGDTFTVSALRSALAPILYGGLMSVGIAYTLQIVAQKNADPTTAAIIFSTEAAFSAIGAAIILKEVMQVRGYIGCVLIFAGLVLAQLKLKKKSRQDEKQEAL